MAIPTARPLSKRVLLMGTCLCDAFYDDVARASVEILEHLGISVDFPEDQTCCGQPAFNSGEWSASRKVANHAAEVFAGELPVIVPYGSCAAMNRHGNLLQFEENPDPAIDSLAGGHGNSFDFIYNGLDIKTGRENSNNRRASPSTAPATAAAPNRRSVRTLLSSIENADVVPFGQAGAMLRFRRHVLRYLPAYLRPDGHPQARQHPRYQTRHARRHRHVLPDASFRPRHRPRQTVPHKHVIQILRDTLVNR